MHFQGQTSDGEKYNAIQQQSVNVPKEGISKQSSENFIE
jgi:hypothetical protein